MAVSTDVWYNNGIQGISGVGADVDIFESHSTPKFAIGTRFTRSDGAEFVYSHFGTAVTDPGVIVATDFSESGTSRMGGRILASGSVTAISGETVNPNASGSHYVEIYGGGITADQFAGGYFQIAEHAGAVGHTFTYRIKGNTASSAKTSGAAHTYYLELFEPLQKAIGAGQDAEFRILGSPYGNLESASSGTDIMVAGVTTASHAASTYGWVQCKGIAGVRTDATFGAGLGSAISISQFTSGCAGRHYRLGRSGPPSQEFILGYCVASGNATGVNVVAAQLLL